MCRRFLLLVALLPLAVRADVTLAPLFTDHAVLQQDKAVPVWGRAAPGEPVAVTFRDQTVRATAGKDGSWIVYLAPQKPGAPADLVVSGKNTLRLHDILVGEVWVCSGQSNMEFTVWGPPGAVYRVDRADEEVAAAHYPLIRQFKVEHAVAARPADTAYGAWVVCSPDTVGQFTAVGYFFARDLFQKLDVPVGIINSTWGGTAIESWLSDAALQSDPAFAVVDQRWAKALAGAPAKKAEREALLATLAREEAAARAAGPAKYADFLKNKPWLPPLPGPDSPDAPRSLFNGMINPLLPGAIRGILWYQGESNVGRPAEYGRLFKALITHWRLHWGQGDLPFYFVQLPNYQGSGRCERRRLGAAARGPGPGAGPAQHRHGRDHRPRRSGQHSPAQQAGGRPPPRPHRARPRLCHPGRLDGPRVPDGPARRRGAARDFRPCRQRTHGAR